MQRLEVTLKLYYAVLFAVLVGGILLGGNMVTQSVCHAMDSVSASTDAITATVNHVNAKNGTIAMLDEDMGAAKSLIIHGDLVARQEQQSLNVWDARGAELYANVNGAVTDTRATLQAGKGTLDAATAAVQEGQRTIKAAQPILVDADATVKDVHVQAVATLAATTETAQHAAAIGESGAKIANHYEQAIDNPKVEKWYIRILPATLKELVQAGVTYAALH